MSDTPIFDGLTKFFLGSSAPTWKPGDRKVDREAVRQARANGMSIPRLMETFGVSEATIKRALYEFNPSIARGIDPQKAFDIYCAGFSLIDISLFFGRTNTGAGSIGNLLKKYFGEAYEVEKRKHLSDAKKGVAPAAAIASIVGVHLSEKTKDKIRKSRLGKKMPQISAAKKGQMPARHTIEAAHSEEANAKRSKSLTGRKVSDVTKRKLSISHTGHTDSEETKSRKAEAQRKRWNRNFYPTLDEASAAARKLGIRTSTDYRVLYKNDPRLPSAPMEFYPNWSNWEIFVR